MGKSYNKWERFYHQLNMVFNGIIALSMIPFAWAFLETQRQFPDPPIVEADALMPIKIFIALSCIAVMAFNYRFNQNLLSKAKALPEVADRLAAYLKEKKKDYLLLEIAAIIAFVGLWITKDHLFSVLYVGVLMMFSTKRPTYNRITRELAIKDEEVNKWIEE